MYALVIALAMATAPAPVVPDVPAHFQISFTRTTDGYSAECTSGCKWTTLAFACGAECSAVIDESGVAVDPTATQGANAFAFKFHRTAEGFELVSLGGTAWVDLSWSCGRFACAAHVDELGVSGSGIGR